MTHFFIRVYRYLHAHPAVRRLSMLLLFLFFGYFAVQLHLEEDINQLMPSSKNPDGTTKLAFADLKIKDKTFLLFSLPPGRAASDSTCQRLTEVCDAFVDSLLVRDSVTHSIGDAFYRLDDELLPDVVDYLSAHLPSYIDTAAYAGFDTLLTRQHLLRQMQQNHADLDGDFGSAFPELIQVDPLGMRTVLASQLQSLVGDSDGGYRTLDGHFFVPDSTVCLCFLTPRYSGTNTGQGSALFVMLNQLVQQFAQSHPDVRITYHGTPASGYYNSTQIKHDLTTTIAGALVLVLLFLLFCFRRWLTVPLLLLPVAFGTLFALAVMYWLKGEFSLLALGIGGVVLGVALSYVLHVMTHHRYVSDPEQLLRDQVKPVLLGCLTTIGSFSALIFVHTDLLRDFGLFASFAILATTLFSLVYLPHLLAPRRSAQGAAVAAGDSRQPFPAFVEAVNTHPFDRNKVLLAVIVLLSVVCIGAYVVGGTHFDADMHNLGYDQPDVAYSEQLLRDKTTPDAADPAGDKTEYFASQGRTMEEAIAHFSRLSHKLDSLQHLGLVRSYTPIDRVFVTLAEQQRRIDAWHRYWTPGRLALVHRLIAETAPAADLQPEAFQPFFDAATATYEPDALYAAGLIPAGYLSTLMEQSLDGTYLFFTSVRCANDAVRSRQSDYHRICDAVASDPHLLVLDTYYYTTDTLLQMSRDFDRLQWLSMLFVFVVLLFSFTTRPAGALFPRFRLLPAVLAFMPILLSWLIVLGAMNLFHQQFNLISIIISTFIFGIGVDYSIFIMQGLLSSDASAPAGSRSLLSCHKTAILFSAVTLLVTVGSMLLAVHPAIRSVGFSTLVGLVSAIVLSYVLQPAMWRKVKSEK